MTAKKKVLCAIGTRPEAIKMAPVILKLREQAWCDLVVLATAQHRDMLDQVLSIFNIVPDYDLDIMQKNQALPELTARLIMSMDQLLTDIEPVLVLAQGDTTTVMVTAMSCFYKKIPFAHVEAGLRTGDIYYPYPEEMNRVVTGHMTTLHFAPTETSNNNLLKENIDQSSIYVTGNTVIDALIYTAKNEYDIGIDLDSGKRLVLLTSHRRENFGAAMEEAFTAILELAEHNRDIEILYPVHPNPNVLEVANRILGNHDRIHLIEPLAYPQFVQAMKSAYIIISDSGGVQEEAPALSKPVLVLRNETERPEAVDMGVVKLVGTDKKVILHEANKLLNDEDYYSSVAKGVSPYGDGHSAERIVNIIKDYFFTRA
ncbi:MAG: UDP-N-acetylglucosamine 2-epimerase (non-hydrolyzing) [Candidatus Thiodiazotropha lotti]|nr:UDP-N-acetylglucosamine 2-epimerase (non-hydrolyzing) [Candidatus Thiodiazotropha lotti]MCG8002495.1 UDP-N-acetylglucosamine 2-epimerase (non-hydrolyzing) [Candidatus Thiodiazotropha lotti]MCG8008344.1 UDP-N-acetylglucosamine 2-epimerase (non-hydrolyzing) [Candidatus Thiodiazotropha lotti]MCW4186114.1 UDP-N-acetylglucosamine 2-epimerase (non-hydrolyzing) [Candidatus Thiodiazotropha lotti]MCW4195932.1 UDP-N-acetylglucosamine 2-epimerase (non-hydrolyzing) [Candidatus Thiodiazotropha lotti]